MKTVFSTLVWVEEKKTDCEPGEVAGESSNLMWLAHSLQQF